MTTPAWDTLIRNALVFDGSGGPPRQQDIALKDGRVAARGQALPLSEAGRIIEGEGKWLLPGLLDIHTHLDLEVDLEPGLPEVVRHGTTTVLVGNCSLGTCFGQQVEGEQNPIVDCFTRVENIPKSVLQKCVDAVSWSDTGAYLDHFADIPLGPNVGVFVPHSMLRVEVMGLQDSISREPDEAELKKMEALLGQALDQGYLGMSTDGLPFHYLANEPHTDQRIPTQFASFGEMKRLLQGGAGPQPGVADHAHPGESRQGLPLFPVHQRPPVRQDPENLGAVGGAFRAGAESLAALPRFRRPGQQPAAQGQSPLPGPGHQFPDLVGRHRQPPVRGAGIHQQADCEGIRRCGGPARPAQRPAVHRGFSPGLALRPARPQPGPPQGPPGYAGHPRGAGARAHDI